jgi:hypothetical protein
MFGTPRRDPRAPGDTRMYLYFDYSPLGAARAGGSASESDMAPMLSMQPMTRRSRRSEE